MSYNDLNEYMTAMNYVHIFQKNIVTNNIPTIYGFVGFNNNTTYQTYSSPPLPPGMVWQYSSYFGYLTSTTVPVSQL